MVKFFIYAKTSSYPQKENLQENANFSYFTCFKKWKYQIKVNPKKDPSPKFGNNVCKEKEQLNKKVETFFLFDSHSIVPDP